MKFAWPVMTVRVSEITSELRRKTMYRMIHLRQKIFNMAQTLVEVFEYSQIGNSESQSECHEQLRQVIDDTKSSVQDEQKVLADLLSQYHALMLHSAAIGSDHGEREARQMVCAHTCKLWGQFAAATVFVGMLAPRLLSRTSLTKNWYKPTHRVGDRVYLHLGQDKI
mmetsp:Transcript_73631/g.159304  ORF Transcript_73631/g.159304 Transcript_73631/m.159304 type:complete len:167 (-) Transcript_73631:165-665(-)